MVPFILLHQSIVQLTFLCRNCEALFPYTSSIRLLVSLLIGRRAVQPYGDKRKPSAHRDPDSADPYPCSADFPTPRPLIVREVPYCDLSFFVDVREERPLVVDAKVEDPVLIG